MVLSRPLTFSSSTRHCPPLSDRGLSERDSQRRTRFSRNASHRTRAPSLVMPFSLRSRACRDTLALRAGTRAATPAEEILLRDRSKWVTHVLWIRAWLRARQESSSIPPLGAGACLPLTTSAVGSVAARNISFRQLISFLSRRGRVCFSSGGWKFIRTASSSSVCFPNVTRRQPPTSICLMTSFSCTTPIRASTPSSVMRGLHARLSLRRVRFTFSMSTSRPIPLSVNLW
mmetsp:Transcript_62791/g.111984  ORF Transcript_62791/g.111984 Transcript_62791/m.111984 type:complete len:230 (+) Transcript_62791:1158-1847(+)